MPGRHRGDADRNACRCGYAPGQRPNGDVDARCDATTPNYGRAHAHGHVVAHVDGDGITPSDPDRNADSH